MIYRSRIVIIDIFIFPYLHRHAMLTKSISVYESEMCPKNCNLQWCGQLRRFERRKAKLLLQVYYNDFLYQLIITNKKT